MENDPSATAATAADELSRLTALYASGLLDDGAPSSLDTLLDLTAALLDCPTAVMSLIDRDTVHVRASGRAPAASIPRAVSLCDHAIREPGGLVVPDLAEDARFADYAVAAECRFYAGMPIHAPDAAGRPHPVGALCVVDAVPRRFDADGRQRLRQVAELADALIAARADTRHAVDIAVEHERLVAERVRQHRLFAQAERMTGIGSWRFRVSSLTSEWSEGVYRIYGLPPGTDPDLHDAINAYPPEARGRVAAALARAIEHGEPFDFEEDFHPATGGTRRVRCIGEREWADGDDVALIGVFHDVTDRHRMETALRRDADTDALTGLANRAAFDKRLAAAIARARRHATPLLLALVDLDGFKAVNDTLGHAAGDDVLRQVGAALRALPVAAGTIARIGGDEFALLIERDGDAAEVAAIIERALILSAGGDGLTLACSGSVGTALLDDGDNGRDFFHRADVALYAAKRARIGERRRVERRAA